MRGVIKWFDPARGYGFIQPDAGGNDVFVHLLEMRKAGMSTITEGLAVEFDEMPAPGKPGKFRAANVRRLPNASPPAAPPAAPLPPIRFGDDYADADAH